MSIARKTSDNQPSSGLEGTSFSRIFTKKDFSHARNSTLYPRGFFTKKDFSLKNDIFDFLIFESLLTLSHLVPCKACDRGGGGEPRHGGHGYP